MMRWLGVMVLFGIGLAGGFTLLAVRPSAARDERPQNPPLAESKPTEITLYRSPHHLCFSPDGRWAYVASQTSDSVFVLDCDTREVAGEIPVDRRPTHLAISGDGRRLYVTCHDANRLLELDTAQKRVLRRISTGYGPCGAVLSRDGLRLYVANALSGTVSIISLESGKTQFEVPVEWDPRYVAETPDGSTLVVSHGLMRGVTIIDPAAGKALEFRRLGEAAILRQIACSQDYAFVTHLVSRDVHPTTQMEFGQVHSNGFTIIPLREKGRWVTLLLDRLLQGAANPWGLVVSPDDKWLYVSLAGTHEIAIVDLPKALQLAQETSQEQTDRLARDVEILEKRKIMRRVPAGGIGPRGLALHPSRQELWVGNYFSESLSVLASETGQLLATIPLGPPQEMTLRRKGEMLFNDARLCFQQWFTCASCHQEDALVDGLNWDLVNDGEGNPKNNKSLYDIHDTPPAMWTGVRKNMEVAVAAGQLFLGFAPKPENQEALLAYIGSLQHQPNPYRENPTPAAARGERLFRQARCHVCHPPPTYADLQRHDLGLRAETDLHSRYDTPSLRDCFRTRPYLHDGRAKTLKEIFTLHNTGGLHGLVGGFTDEDLNDLVAFLMTL